MRVVGSLAWAAALAKRLRDKVVVVQHPEAIPIKTGIPAESSDLLVIHISSHASPASSATSVIELLIWLAKKRPLVSVVVVGEAAVRYRWCFMEAGAIAAVDYVWNVHVVANLALRCRKNKFEETIDGRGSRKCR